MQTSVVVIDDDFATTELLKMVLEPNNFYVVTANSGEKGVELTRRLSPDVVIVDLRMPDMDGVDVCKEVRKFSDVPILVVSAISTPNMVAQVLDEGADDYLVKPMKSGVLVAHLNKMTRRARTGQLFFESGVICQI